jgi:RNA polymerase sigma-70 factor (ECF subfamily)
MAQAPAVVESSVVRSLEALRAPIFAYCYRMLGSSHDAEDAVQETMARAWRSLERLEEPSGLRPWVYRIATNVCIDAATRGRRRALPMDLAGPSDGRDRLGAPLPESVWVEPIPSRLVTAVSDPLERAVSRETIRLAFVAALQHLLPRQRAVVILRDVFRWRAAEVAELLETSVDAVNSTLRRARTALAAARGAETPRPADNTVDLRLLEAYVDAFERFDVDRIVALLRRDVVVSMPPFSFWLRGRTAFRVWLESSGLGCQHAHLEIIEANGGPAMALFRVGADGSLEPSAIHVPEWHRGQVSSLHAFLDPTLFSLFALGPTTAAE